MTRWRSPHIETECDKDDVALAWVVIVCSAIPVILAVLIAAGLVWFGVAA